MPILLGLLSRTGLVALGSGAIGFSAGTKTDALGNTIKWSAIAFVAFLVAKQMKLI